MDIRRGLFVSARISSGTFDSDGDLIGTSFFNLPVASLRRSRDTDYTTLGYVRVRVACLAGMREPQQLDRRGPGRRGAGRLRRRFSLCMLPPSSCSQLGSDRALQQQRLFEHDVRTNYRPLFMRLACGFFMTLFSKGPFMQCVHVGVGMSGIVSRTMLII